MSKKKRPVVARAPQPIRPNGNRTLEIETSKGVYLRLPIKTPMLTESDDLFQALETYVHPHAKPGDFIFISEKLVCVTQGRIIPYRSVKVGRLARLFASKVNNKIHTKDFRGFGHGTAVAMQLLIEEAGYPRAIFAAGVAALTLPLGIHGAFYYLVGKQAKSIDCPMSFSLYPYLHYAKLAPMKPRKLAREIRARTGHDTVVIDANYRGVCTLGIAGKGITEKFAQELFRDNPLGQSEEMTPFCIVRKAIA